MRRVTSLLGFQYEEHNSDYAKDLNKIRTYISNHIPQFATLSSAKVEQVWDCFSGSRDAGWLFVNEETLPQFRDWLLEDV